MTSYEGQNLRRLLAQRGLSLSGLARRARVDRRTIRAVLAGKARPRADTLKRLAEALNAPVDEFFVEPAQLAYRTFDRHTNPVVDDVIAARPELFRGWSPADFEELFSRMGTGGPLTFEGAVAAAEHLNQRRDLQEKFALLLESSHAVLLRTIVELLYEQVVVKDDL
jgi:transcriptional regulator with XRE-family HTH domain